MASMPAPALQPRVDQLPPVDLDRMRTHAEDAATLLRSVGNSQHLAVLRAAGLVRARREGVQVFYSLADGAVRPLMHTLHAIYCGGNQA